MLVKHSCLTDKESPLTLNKKTNILQGMLSEQKKNSLFLLSYDVQALKRNKNCWKVYQKECGARRNYLRIRQIANLVQKAAYSRPLAFLLKRKPRERNIYLQKKMLNPHRNLEKNQFLKYLVLICMVINYG